MNNIGKKQSSLDKLLDEITPEEQERTDAKMLLAAKIADAMEAKGWNNKMLMEAMGKKNPSQITKWLSGTHNFTTETLIDLGRVLDTNFLNLMKEETTNQRYSIIVPIKSIGLAESKNIYHSKQNVRHEETLTFYYNGHGKD